jgi:hypothetical protein
MSRYFGKQSGWMSGCLCDLPLAGCHFERRQRVEHSLMRRTCLSPDRRAIRKQQTGHSVVPGRRLIFWARSIRSREGGGSAVLLDRTHSAVHRPDTGWISAVPTGCGRHQSLRPEAMLDHAVGELFTGGAGQFPLQGLFRPPTITALNNKISSRRSE